MFETAELGRKVTKEEYDTAVPALRTELLRVQNELLRDPRFSVVIVIGGVDGAGKGETVRALHEWMDPRYMEAHAFGPPSDEEAERPEMWRFWRVLPPRGRIGMFFGSWYTLPILRRAYGQSGDAKLEVALAEVASFEKALVDDGTLIVKFWFHLSKRAQKKRLRALSKDPAEAWRVTDEDWKHFELYDTFVPISERALRATSTGEAPWTLIEGYDRRYRELAAGQHLLSAISKRLAITPAARPPKAARPKPIGHRQPTILNTLDLSLSLDDDVYKPKLARLQGRLNRLSRKTAASGASVVLVFEGSDAAGKGGAIRRITAALDPRHYKIIPIAAPSDEERARHYLWRFWRHLPRAGKVIIFDRSWYGRVLVERVEGFASEPAWRRAYREINDFEERLTQHGMGVMKFWMHIDKDEQMRRFKARESTSYKQYKITEEDYRNRKSWDAYEDAVNDMVERTSTAHAPWTLIEANEKRWARVRILQGACKAFVTALSRRKQR